MNALPRPSEPHTWNKAAWVKSATDYDDDAYDDNDDNNDGWLASQLAS